ncbi:MAG: hypothetical protein IPN60_08130 [Saprospiraceae bacterium]|nr:hypothetical protein [Candidatus Opimibacter skivensis]
MKCDRCNGFFSGAAGLVSSPPAGDFGGAGEDRWYGVLATGGVIRRWPGVLTTSGRFRWLLVGTPTTASPGGEMPLVRCPHHQREISVVVGGDTNNGFAGWGDAAGTVSSPPAGVVGWWGHQQRLRRWGRCRWLGAYTPSGRFRWLLVGTPTTAAPEGIIAFSSRG